MGFQNPERPRVDKTGMDGEQKKTRNKTKNVSAKFYLIDGINYLIDPMTEVRTYRFAGTLATKRVFNRPSLSFASLPTGRILLTGFHTHTYLHLI